MKKLIVSALVALGLVACAGDRTQSPILIAGVQVAVLEYIGNDVEKAKRVVMLADRIDVVLVDDVVTLAELQVAVDGMIPYDQLSLQQRILVRAAVSTVFQDLALFAPEGVLDATTVARVKLYTAAVRDIAQAVVDQNGAVTATQAAQGMVSGGTRYHPLP